MAQYLAQAVDINSVDQEITYFSETWIFIIMLNLKQ
jgi:hypothetical protein